MSRKRSKRAYAEVLKRLITEVSDSDDTESDQGGAEEAAEARRFDTRTRAGLPLREKAPLQDGDTRGDNVAIAKVGRPRETNRPGADIGGPGADLVSNNRAEKNFGSIDLPQKSGSAAGVGSRTRSRKKSLFDSKSGTFSSPEAPRRFSTPPRKDKRASSKSFTDPRSMKTSKRMRRGACTGNTPTIGRRSSVDTRAFFDIQEDIRKKPLRALKFDDDAEVKESIVGIPASFSHDSVTHQKPDTIASAILGNARKGKHQNTPIATSRDEGQRKAPKFNRNAMGWYEHTPKGVESLKPQPDFMNDCHAVLPTPTSNAQQANGTGNPRKKPRLQSAMLNPDVALAHALVASASMSASVGSQSLAASLEREDLPTPLSFSGSGSAMLGGVAGSGMLSGVAGNGMLGSVAGSGMLSGIAGVLPSPLGLEGSGSLFSPVGMGGDRGRSMSLASLSKFVMDTPKNVVRACFCVWSFFYVF